MNLTLINLCVQFLSRSLSLSWFPLRNVRSKYVRVCAHNDSEHGSCQAIRIPYTYTSDKHTSAHEEKNFNT